MPKTLVRKGLCQNSTQRRKGPNRILVYPNRVGFFSPGVFPGPLRVGQLELGMTHSRNHAIMKVFREAGYIKSLGSGFPTIFHTYRKANLEKPQVMEGVEFVKCILPRSRLHTTEDPAYNSILELFSRKNAITKREVMKEANISSATATRLLAKLTENGKLKRLGKGPATYYIQST